VIARERILSVAGLVVGYEKKPVLKGVNVEVGVGEIVAVVGHNGAGKSTLLKSIFGLLPAWSGEIVIKGVPRQPSRPAELLRLGVAYVPQGNRVFGDLTVGENLQVASSVLSDQAVAKEGFDRACDLFPILGQRLQQRASTLSGGEKQMLALAGALITRPRLLLLDEPSLGLGPKLVGQALETVREIRSSWQTSILIVEQKVRDVLRISDRAYVFRNGVISYSGPAGDLADDVKLKSVFL
jgi:ABC-type branched-subunit amino acid transport system ATPase component